MNTLLESEQEHQDHGGRSDREITLGTATVLGIFFVLAILCAVFFGFGYSLGSKHPAPSVAAADTAPSRTFSAFKPAPGSPLPSKAVNPYEPPAPADSAKFVNTPAAKATPAAFSADPTPAPTRPAASTPTIAALAVLPAPAASQPSAVQSIVQIAAVSHQEDADAIATSLKRRGYNVVVRQEPQDKLLHIQVGPFAAKKDAEAMRQKLLGDGFNAYIK